MPADNFKNSMRKFLSFEISSEPPRSKLNRTEKAFINNMKVAVERV